MLDELLFDRKDIVLGAKGAGKSALWKEIQDSPEKYEILQDIRLHPITNPSGDPEFRDILAAISQESFPDPEELRVGWRLYFLAQFWRAAKPILENTWEVISLEEEMRKYGIVAESDRSLKLAFAYAISKARKLKNLEIKWLEGVSFEFSEESLQAGGSAVAIPFNDLMRQINSALSQVKKRVWLILDRLDEIVLGDEERENIVLKGLLLAFRDMCDYPNARIKIFLRDDVYNRVTSIGHFPALTHVRSKATVPIRWELEDLRHLVILRFLANHSIEEYLKSKNIDAQTSDGRKNIYYYLFPEKIDKGRAAEGFKWIVDRITDGNDIATPRDLLSVVDTARQYQIEQMERESLEIPGERLFTEDTLKKSVRKVAKDNLETRVFAEYPDLRQSISAFSGQKADHNNDTLKSILGDNWEDILLRLERVGFVYSRTKKGVPVWTIPFFYSFALGITRGSAFDLGSTDLVDEDEDFLES
ncbi:MAG: hypothetical protein DCF32_17870 [Leptolyngbya sp.]|nr:MAG: hypothetical protein DCF32_17870 [Leptolyngbya sp.]